MGGVALNDFPQKGVKPMPEGQIEIGGVEEIKTQTAIRKVMVKGEEIDRQLVTKVTLWLPQLSMKLED